MSFDDDSQSCLALAVINGIPGLVRRLLDFGGVNIDLVPVWSDPNNIPAGYPFSPYQLSVIYSKKPSKGYLLSMEEVQVLLQNPRS